MTIFSGSKSISATLLLSVIGIILLVVSVLNVKVNTDDKTELLSHVNPYYEAIPSNLIAQIEETEKKDSLYIYSVSVLDNPIERKLILINKNPSRKEFMNKINIHVYPTDTNNYKAISNYEKDGFLDYSSPKKPIMYSHNGDNYSVLSLVLPQIDISRINLHQPSIYKATIENPFPQAITMGTSQILPKNEQLFSSVFHELLKKYEISFLPDNYVKKDTLLIENYAKTHSRTIIKISNSPLFFRLLEDKDKRVISYASIIGNDSETVLALLRNHQKGKLLFSDVFNVEKLASYYAIVNLFTDNEQRELGLVLNKDDNKLEPFYCNTSTLGQVGKYIKNENITAPYFLKTYAKSLMEIGHISLENLFQSIPGLPETIRQFNLRDPSILFDSALLRHNQLILLKGTNPSTAIKAELLSLKDYVIKISVSNLSDFPIVITGLNYQTKKSITSVGSETIVPPRGKDSIVFKLRKSFENLFVHKKKQNHRIYF